MSSDTAKARNLRPNALTNPAAAARAEMDAALVALEALLSQRLTETAPVVAPPDETAQWRNATRLLEEQLTALREENSILHSEVHKLRQEALALTKENKALKAASADALKAVDEAARDIRSLLEE